MLTSFPWFYLNSAPNRRTTAG